MVVGSRLSLLVICSKECEKKTMSFVPSSMLVDGDTYVPLLSYHANGDLV